MGKMLEWKCPLCGGDVVMERFATVCMSCDVSLDPDTGRPFRDEGEVVRSAWFGGGN